MDIKTVKELVKGKEEEFTWADGAGLWTLARNKACCLTVLEIYIKQAKDQEVKSFIETAIKSSLSDFKKIQEFFRKESQPVPYVHHRTALEMIDRETGENRFLTDPEIASTLREMLSLVLYLETRVLLDAVRKDVLNLNWSFMEKDYRAFRKSIGILRKNQWELSSPIIKTQLKGKESLTWNEGIALWDIAQNKLIGLTVLEVFESQAVDPALKLLLSQGLRKNAVPHIERIQEFLKQEGLELPYVFHRSNLHLVGRQTGMKKFIADDEIASSIREILRLSLTLVGRGIKDASREDVIDLIWQIFQDDFNSFKTVLQMYKEKNWLLKAPTIN